MSFASKRSVPQWLNSSLRKDKTETLYQQWAKVPSSQFPKCPKMKA